MTTMKTRFKIGLLVTSVLVLLLGYNNCSKHAGYRSLTSQEIEMCDADLKTLYANTYYAYVFRDSTCFDCHSNGGDSPYKFASEDLTRAFATFNQLGGHSALYAKAIDPMHGGPTHTGSQNQVAFDTLGTFWKRGMDQHEACLTSRPYVEPALQTMGKVADSIYYSSNNTQRLSWFLNNPADVYPGKKPINVKINLDVRVWFSGTPARPIGYIFDNLTFEVQNGTDRVVLEGFYIFVNHTLVPDLADFSALSRTITGTDPVAAIRSNNGQGFRVQMPMVSNKDAISLYIRNFSGGLRTDNPPRPANPIFLTASPRYVNQNGANNIQVTVQRDPTIRKICATLSATPPASTNDPCPGSESLKPATKGWDNFSAGDTNNSTITFNLSQMTGLPTTSPAMDNQPYPVYFWVANADLLMNANPTAYTVIYDNTPPATPTLNDVTFTSDAGNANMIAAGGNQVVGINASYPGDAIEYCAVDVASNATPANTAVADATINANNFCWQTSPYNYRSLLAAGPRLVGVYVKDRAGNVSRPAQVTTTVNGQTQTRLVVKSRTDMSPVSNLFFINNPYSAVGWGQLTAASGINAAVTRLKAACTSGAACASFNNMTTDYSTANGNRSAIAQQIRSGAVPPSAASISDQDRELIKTWCSVNGIQ